MLTVKEKLYFLDRPAKTALRESGMPEAESHLADPSQLEDADAKIVNGDGYYYILREKAFDLNFMHGGTPLGKFLSITSDNFKCLAADSEYKDLLPHNYLFIDTETTGLAGGTGTYIFLLGIGYFENERFIIQQYLLPDFACEAGMMAQIQQKLARIKGFVSYNGKSYDIPLLRTRLILNKLKTDDIDRKQHVDLLHCSRRLWKKYTQCSLQAIETEILGFARQNDIPGKDIPAVYFNFLKTKDMAPLKTVLKHNVIDILSMVSIASHATYVICNFANDLQNKKFDRHGLFRVFTRMGDVKRAIKLAESTKNDGDIQLNLEYGFLLKKLGQHQQAEKVWRHLIASRKMYENAYLELAKYLEHHKRDISEALSVVEKAMKRIEISTSLFPETQNQFKEDWKHRKNRLVRKMNNDG